MSEAMKPCPFCGGEAEAIPYDGQYMRAFIVCKTCGASVAGSGFKRTAVEDAQANWNRRAPSPEVLNVVHQITHDGQNWHAVPRALFSGYANVLERRVLVAYRDEPGEARGFAEAG